MKNKQPSFQPVVEDNNGIIRKQFDDLQSKVRISKKTLAAKIFELGMAQITANEQITIKLATK